MITINGDIYITNYGQPINEIVGEEQEFDYDELDCDGDCELCACDECNEDDEKITLGELVEYYAQEISDNECTCPECIESILWELVEDILIN